MLNLLIRSRTLNTLCNTCAFLNRSVMNLASVVKVVEGLIPPHLSEPWDNTGLLVEPEENNSISTILFTNDLTEDVLNEALSVKANLIISYHPLIFSPIKSLRSTCWKDRIVMQCVKHSIAVYSPHTSCDAVKGGVNDWLIKGFDLSDSWPIKQSYEASSNFSHILYICIPVNMDVNHIIKSIPNVRVTVASADEKVQHVKIMINKDSLIKVLENVAACKMVISTSLVACSPLPLPAYGMGRIAKLRKPMKIQNCIRLLKEYLKLNQIRFSFGMSHTLDTEISVIAVCAGSGAGLLKGVAADLYITGEMSHHDLLDATHNKVSVFLCEHSNSERGYLQELVQDLRQKLQGIYLSVSSIDKDPVTIL